MISIQDHTPNGIASMYFGGVIKRISITIGASLNYEQIKHRLLFDYHIDGFYTMKNNLKMMIDSAKQFNMYLIVNNNIQWFDKDISVETYAKISGIIADILEEDFNKNTAAIALMNEPGKYGDSNWYIPYCNKSNEYVKGRFPLILVNDEYHHIDEKHIFDSTKNIPNRIFGVHHLSSLGNPPRWQNIIDAKTQANEWKVPIICTEGGSWFEDYQSAKGHAINVKLLSECKKYDYKGCAIVTVDTNIQTKKNYKLGYRVWEDDYSKILSQTNWDKFENELKKYKEDTMPEERDLVLTYPYMYGNDVKAVQQKLVDIGFDFYPWGVDEWYGPATKAAVKKYQELAHLHRKDGVVDKTTRESLMAMTVSAFYPEVFQDIFITKSYEVEAIDYYLKEFAHPDIYGHGKYFVQAETETDIPCEWQLSNGAQESSYKGGGIGSSPVAQKYNNLYGWAYGDSGPMPGYRFASFKDCILEVARKIKSLYLTPGGPFNNGTNIYGIEIRYSSAPYNAIMKAKYYRAICTFLDTGIKIPVPKYVEDLIVHLDKYYVRKT